ncbi:hypothetical protein M569_15965, partial [Genlisea aurea]
LESLLRRLSAEQVPVRVHDIIIKGNTKTKDFLIESMVEELFRGATSFQQLLQAAGIANMRLQGLEIFDLVNITLDAGPPELPGTANVVIDVSELKSPLSADFGMYTKPQARSWAIESSVKMKNLFGHGDIWDGLVGYGGSQTLEISTGVSVPRFRSISNPLSGRIFLLSQDWLKFSSFKERALGLSCSIFTSQNHELSYNLSWRTLTDPSQMASFAVRSQLGHGLFSGLKYGFKVDRRDQPLRPTSGYAFASTTNIYGLFPDIRSFKLFRQEFDLRYAIPLGFLKAALNLGVSAGVVCPWGNGSSGKPSYLPERFFMDGNASPVCSLKGPTSVYGFKSRGLGPAQPRRRRLAGDDDENSSGMDRLGGDLAVTAFADLSFDLPLKFLRDAGIHGHLFASTGSLTPLTENSYREIASLQGFRESFRSSAGFGLVVPTKLFRMEANYCYILKQQEHDCGKTGIQFSFSA